jgi:flagellar biosynthesis protein FlhG
MEEALFKVNTLSDTKENLNEAEEFPNPPVAEPAWSASTQQKSTENPFSELHPSPTARVRQVWAIGGGKGGVGKSLIASSLAITLAQQGFRVAAIDLDLGAANLHTALGVHPPKSGLGDFLLKRIPNLSDAICQTEVANLTLISGAQDSANIANLPFELKVSLLQEIRELKADYVILDLGAGTHLNTLDFFLFSDIGILTLLPEPTSIENAYRFLKSLFYRRLHVSEQLHEIHPLIEKVMDSKNDEGIRSPSDLYQYIRQNHPHLGKDFEKEIQSLNPKLVINQIRTMTDVDIGFSVQSVCKKYFGIEIDYAGYMDYDSSVWQTVRRKRPLLLEFPNSKIVSHIDRITQYLLKRHSDSNSPMTRK